MQEAVNIIKSGMRTNLQYLDYNSELHFLIKSYGDEADGKHKNLRFIQTKKGSQMTPFAFVGAAGFEPAASWSQTRRANRTALRPVYV